MISFFSTKQGTSAPPFYESHFFTHPEMWSRVSPKMRFKIQDPRLFSRSKSPIFSVYGTFEIHLDDFLPSTQGRVLRFIELSLGGNAYCLSSRWHVHKLENLYFGWNPFPQGNRRELIEKGLATLFVAPEQVEYTPAHLDYSKNIQLPTLACQLPEGRKSYGMLTKFSSYEHETIRASIKERLPKKSPIFFREYISPEEKRVLDHLFFWEREMALPSGDWRKEGGKLIMWVTKEIREKNIQILLP